MTLDEFVTELRTHAHKTKYWRIHSTNCLRNYEGQCPIMFVYQQVKQDDEFRIAKMGRTLGLDDYDRGSIMIAADQSSLLSPALRTLRQRMIEAVGIEQ